MHVSDSQDHIISHDPATHQVKQEVPLKKPRGSVVILIILGLFLVITGAAWYFNGQSFDFSDNGVEFSVEPVDETVVATVGSENIYGQDLNYKKSQTPDNLMTAELEAALLDRLIDESIILQAGADLNYVELNESVFNSPFKDQQARQRLITEVTEKVNENASFKKGAYVSIWFMNMEPGPIGYEAGKQAALEKITPLRQAVANGTMTIKQAGDAIRNDPSLAKVDPTSYQANSYNEFDTSVNEKITFDQTFNEEILALEEGGTTSVYLAQDHEQGDSELPLVDAVYMFAQVTEIKADGQLPFSAWLAAEKNNYAVTKN